MLQMKHLHNALKEIVGEVSVQAQKTYPNVKDENGLSLPRLETTFSGGDQTSDCLDPADGDETAAGVMTVVVCTELHGNGGEDIALDLAGLVKAAFPKGLRKSFTGGRIVLQRPASIRSGYPDKTCWRVPVVIRYTAQAV